MDVFEFEGGDVVGAVEEKGLAVAAILGKGNQYLSPLLSLKHLGCLTYPSSSSPTSFPRLEHHYALALCPLIFCEESCNGCACYTTPNDHIVCDFG